MPKVRDQTGQSWMHADAILESGQRPIKRYGDSSIYTCPNCKQRFRMTMTEKGLFTNG